MPMKRRRGYRCFNEVPAFLPGRIAQRAWWQPCKSGLNEALAFLPGKIANEAAMAQVEVKLQ